jgi:phage-related protein
VAKSAILEIAIVATAERALAEFEKVKDKAGESNKALQTGAVVASGAIIGALGSATKAALDHEASIAKLQQSYGTAGLSASNMASDVSMIEASARRTGQSTEDLIGAYSKLVTATHDTTTAQTDLRIAQDLAAFKGMDVAAAASVVEKASMGSTKALKDLGIATKDAAGNVKPAAETMDELARAVQGQADAFGDTAAGKLARYRESMDQTKVAIGEAFLPALTSLLDTLAPVFDWLDRNRDVLQVLAPIIGIAAAAVLGLNVAMKAWATVQWAVNVAMDANPLGLIILGIAALVAAIVIVVTHWEDFRGAIDAVNDALQWVWNIILDVINAVENLASAIGNALGGVGGFLGNAWDFISSPFALPPAPAAGPQPIYLSITATPGDDLPETVYQALREYQRRHHRAELAPAFGPSPR